MKLIAGQSYIFLGDYIYSPDPQDKVFGKVVILDEITSTGGKMITTKATGLQGYVTSDECFAENTPENRQSIKFIKAYRVQKKKIDKRISNLLINMTSF